MSFRAELDSEPETLHVGPESWQQRKPPSSEATASIEVRPELLHSCSLMHGIHARRAQYRICVSDGNNTLMHVGSTLQLEGNVNRHHANETLLPRVQPSLMRGCGGCLHTASNPL